MLLEVIILKDLQFTALAIIGIIAVGALVVSFGGMATGNASYYKKMIEKTDAKMPPPSGAWCYYTARIGSPPTCRVEYSLACYDSEEDARLAANTITTSEASAGIVAKGLVYPKDEPKLQQSMPTVDQSLIENCRRRARSIDRYSDTGPVRYPDPLESRPLSYPMGEERAQPVDLPPEDLSDRKP